MEILGILSCCCIPDTDLAVDDHFALIIQDSLHTYSSTFNCPSEIFTTRLLQLTFVLRTFIDLLVGLTYGFQVTTVILQI